MLIKELPTQSGRVKTGLARMLAELELAKRGLTRWDNSALFFRLRSDATIEQLHGVPLQVLWDTKNVGATTITLALRVLEGIGVTVANERFVVPRSIPVTPVSSDELVAMAEWC